MKLIKEAKVQDFIRETSNLFQSQSLLNSPVDSLSIRCAEEGWGGHLFVRLEDSSGKTCVAGLQTHSDRSLYVSTATVGEIKAFAEALHTDGIALPGISGPKEVIESFVDQWVEYKECNSEVALELRMYILGQLVPPLGVDGAARQANSSDQALLIEWIEAFIREAQPNTTPMTEEQLEISVRHGIESGGFYFWEDQGSSVCLVGSRQESKQGRWISPVYTPPEKRGRGYGSALTAFVSRKIQESGKDVLLFTDQLNPISNSIYQKIGYREVSDFKHVLFK